MLEQYSRKPEFGSISQLPLSRKQRDLPYPVFYPSWCYISIFRMNIFSARTALCKTHMERGPCNEAFCTPKTTFSLLPTRIPLHSTPKNKIFLYLISVLEKPRNSQLQLPSVFITPFQQSRAAAQLPPPCVSWAHCQAGMPREAQLMFVLLHRWALPRLPWPLLESLSGGCCRVELNHGGPQPSLLSIVPLQCPPAGVLLSVSTGHRHQGDLCSPEPFYSRRQNPFYILKRSAQKSAASAR